MFQWARGGKYNAKDLWIERPCEGREYIVSTWIIDPFFSFSHISIHPRKKWVSACSQYVALCIYI